MRTVKKWFCFQKIYQFLFPATKQIENKTNQPGEDANQINNFQCSSNQKPGKNI